jgi:CDP-diacylglycerol--glycerol-3-phosphate 3-phosphatidyltransferase
MKQKKRSLPVLFNLPNLLAMSRIAMAPLLFWIILNPQWFTDQGMHVSWNYYVAALIFVLASVTDFFDGYIARELDQVSLPGKILDPLADKMLVIAGFLGLMMVEQASAWAIYIIIVRELFITGLRTVALGEGIDVAASWAGKVKTVAQMFAIGFLLMHWPYGDWLLWISVILTVYSGLEYLWGFGKAVKERG